MYSLFNDIPADPPKDPLLHPTSASAFPIFAFTWPIQMKPLPIPQTILEQIQEWTTNQKMELNEQETKNMLFNFTKSKQFSTRITLKNKVIETVKETKLLGTIITDNLKWSKIQNHL